MGDKAEFRYEDEVQKWETDYRGDGQALDGNFYAPECLHWSLGFSRK
jgi:hypothetical protein